MFIGHYAPALVAAAHPKAPGLGTLFVAGQLVDFGFFGLALAGVEKMRVVPGITAMNPMDLYHMPLTHSLLGTAVWAALFALMIWAITRNRVGAMLGAGVVLSHWLLDLLVHRPDLTLAGSSPKLGLGLWNHPLIAMPLEIGLICAAFSLFLVKTKARQSATRWPLYALIASLALVQAVNWFGPPPTAYSAEIPVTALLAYSVLAALAWRFGKTRMHSDSNT